MKKNKKKIFFYKYNYLLFFISLIYVILGYEIEYFLLDNNKNNKFKKFLFKYFEIKEINYEDYNFQNPDEFMVKSNYYIDNYFTKNNINNLSKKISNNFFNNLNESEILLKKIYSNKYNNFFETLMLVDYNNNKIENDVYLFCIMDDFIKYVLENINNNKVIKFKINKLIFIIYFLKKFFSILLIQLKLIKNFFLKKNNVNNNSKIYNKKNNIFNKKYLFFPHHGIDYANNDFIKDQYYTFNRNSKLHVSNFLFVALNKNDEGSNYTKKYYIDNNIDHVNLENINRINIFKIDYFKIINLIFISHLKKRLIYSYLQYNYYIKFLKKFNNLQGIFVGYDFLFPLEMCMAARYLNIKTFASQERSNLIYEPGYKIIIDYYNVINSNSQNHIEKYKKNFSYKKLYNIGSMRVQDLYEELFLNNNKSLLEKNYYLNFKYICAVFDFHSEIDYNLNKKRRINNWKNNKTFYKLIDYLSGYQKNVLFIIKSKNYDYFDLEYFNKIIARLNNKPNVIFANKIKNATSYKLLSISNFSICRYSSLCEEMNFFKFPFAVYDEIGFLKKTNFDKFMDIINKNSQINDWISDIINKNKYFNKKNISNESIFHTKKNFQNKIENILS